MNRNIVINFSFNVISISIFTLCLFSCNLIYSALHSVYTIDRGFIHLPDGREGIKLVDRLDEVGTVDSYFNDLEGIEVLKQFTASLGQAEEFDYFVIHENPLPLKTNQILPASLYPYKEELQKKEKGKDFINVNCIQLTKNVLIYYPIELSSGEIFQPKDFIFPNQGDSIPVLAGSDFQEFFQIGTTFEFLYWGKIIQARIIGFLDEGTDIQWKGASPILDDYFLVPFLDCDFFPEQKEDFQFQAISYLTRINGIAVPRDGFKMVDIIDYVDNLSEKYKLPDFLYQGIYSIRSSLPSLFRNLDHKILKILFVVDCLIAFAVYLIIEFKFVKAKQTLLRNRRNLFFLSVASLFRFLLAQILNLICCYLFGLHIQILVLVFSLPLVMIAIGYQYYTYSKGELKFY